MPHKNANGYMTAMNIKIKRIEGKLSYVDEFRIIYDVYFLLKCEVLFTDVASRINSLKHERDKILAQLRNFADLYPGQVKSYIEYQRKIALPLYRSIIKMCLYIADKNMKNKFHHDRYEIIKALMEDMDLIITEMDIIDPPINYEND